MSFKQLPYPTCPISHPFILKDFFQNLTDLNREALEMLSGTLTKMTTILGRHEEMMLMLAEYCRTIGYRPDAIDENPGYGILRDMKCLMAQTRTSMKEVLE